MSDFFEQILSRSFGDAAGVRPRPVARFEAAGVDGAGAGELPDASESDEEASAARHEAAAPPRPPSEPADASAERRAQVEPPARAPGLQPADEVGPHVMPIVARPLTTDDFAASSASSENSRPTSSNSAAPASTPPGPSERGGDRAPTERPAETSARARTPPAGEAALAESPATPAVHVNARRAETPAVVPQLAPAVPELTPSAARESAEASPTDVVRVTIGRIEINVPPPRPRAAAPPPRASAPLRPARSLDDYLRRRDGGGR